MPSTGESAWTPNTALLLAFAEALKYIKSIGMDKAYGECASCWRTPPARQFRHSGWSYFRIISRIIGHRRSAARGNGFRRHRQRVSSAASTPLSRTAKDR